MPRRMYESSPKLNPRKRAALVISLVIAAAIILSGTYAWVSISQVAVNEMRGTSEPGGRVHDDFDGENKDVYVENYGSAPLFVRVKLIEYMENGEGAGLKSLDGSMPNPGNHAVPFASATSIDERATWPAHIPAATVAVCDTGDPKIHDYVTWTMGGDKIFMPTFNRNPEDRATDTSGLGVDALVGSPTSVGRDDPGGDHNDGTHTYWTLGESVVADEEIYDATIPGASTNPGVTHTAKPTLTQAAGVMTMAEWAALGKKAGNYWVYDTDGWAYWANALAPTEATSLLLDEIAVVPPDGDWFYVIDVVGQMATLADISEFGVAPETITANAEELLAIAAATP